MEVENKVSKRNLTPKNSGVNIYNFNYGSYVIENTNKDLYLIDAGTKLIGAQLTGFISKKFGNRPIKKIFLTHYHFNHNGGIAPIINAFGVEDGVYTNGAYSVQDRSPYDIKDPRAKVEMLKAISNNSVNYEYCQSNTEFDEGNIKFKFLAPLPQYFQNGGTTDNPNGSTGAMILLEYGDFSMIFMGDIYHESGILEIWEEHTNDIENVQAVAWPHHGDFGAAKDTVVDPLLKLEIAMIETIGSSVNTINFLTGKGIDHLWLKSGNYTAMKCYKDGTYDKLTP